MKQQQDEQAGLVWVDARSMTLQKKIRHTDLMPSMDQGSFLATVSDTGNTLLLSQHVDGSNVIPNRILLSVFDSESNLLRSVEWPDASFAQQTSFSFRDQKMASVTDTLNEEGDLLLARRCYGVECPSAGSDFRVERISGRDGARVWSSVMKVPARIPAIVDAGLIIRLPSLRDTWHPSLQAFDVQQGKLWVQLQYGYAYTYYADHNQNNLYAVNMQTGDYGRRVFTYRDISTFTINPRDEIVMTWSPYQTVESKEGVLLFK